MEEIVEAPGEPPEVEETPRYTKTVAYYKDLLKKCTSRKEHFEKGWWKRAKAAEEMYDKPYTLGEVSKYPFNILYANTELLLPSLYSATPRPDVTARFGGAQEPAQVCERLLTVLIDDNTPGAESFDSAMEGATLSALVPGCGGARIRHYPGDSRPIRWEEFKYNQLVWGWAKKWAKVPWIAFLHTMTLEQVKREFGLDEKEAQLLKMDKDDESSESIKGQPPTVWVYEMWNKETKEICFLCEEFERVCLKEIANDPLHLAGFYPTPGLLTLVKKPSDLDPVPLFDYYRNQAEELNRVTVRLNRVLSAIRVKGVYSSMLGTTLSEMFSESSTENTMIATSQPMDPNMSGSIERGIWFLPIEKLITVAQQLYQGRQQILQVIYQLTGLADIIRGASVASETATAQELKSKWGTVRLRRMQRTVQVYVRDLLRLAVDGSTAVLKPQQWPQVTGMKLPFAQQKQQAMLAYQQAAMLAESQQQPPPPPPEILKQPSWEEIISALADDTQRTYIIDIETSSTLEIDAHADKQEVVDFMGALQGLTQGLAPLMQLGPQGMKAVKAITLAVVRRFKLGREVESALKDLPDAPPPPPPDPAAEADKAMAQAELQKLQAETQATMQKISAETQAAREKATLDQQADMRKADLDERKYVLEVKRMELKEREMIMQARDAQIKSDLAIKTAQATAAAKPAPAKPRP